MIREFVMTSVFERHWKDLGLDDAELKRLQEELLLSPLKGDVIEGTEGLRKIRFSFNGKGKRSGIRVLYVDLIVAERIYLIAAYSKSVKEDLSMDEKRLLNAMIKDLKKEAGE